MTEDTEVFPWNKNFKTGLEKIDKQHKVIVRLLNQMASYLGNQTNIDSLDLAQVANLLIIIGTDNSLFNQNEVFQLVSLTLERDLDEEVADIVLDSAFVIGNKYLEANNFETASSLFQKIANLASNFNRLALEISCRIRSSRLHKLQGVDNGMTLLDELSPIDDGSLEVASQSDREEYYCLQGYAFSLLEDYG